jgi:TolB protein
MRPTSKVVITAFGVFALAPAQAPVFHLESAIAFVSTRDNPVADPFVAAEIYLMDGNGNNARRITFNDDGDGFPALSPDGKKIVFDSNRLRTDGEPPNTSDLFVMDVDGSGQTFVARGSSASWLPDSKWVAFHASASGNGLPIKPDPGAATSDSDIFVVNVDDAVEHGQAPTNITQNPTAIDDDPDWSPDGRWIVYTSHLVGDNPNNSATAEIYVIDAAGSTAPVRLTFNTEEERAPTWSPDGTQILYSCRKGPTFELCVMNANGSDQVQLTSNTVAELTPTWSPDSSRIAYHRILAGRFQVFVMNRDGLGQTQVTNTLGINAFPNWGEVRVK